MDLGAKTMKRNQRTIGASDAADLRVLADIVERFEGKRVVVLGDFVADSFQYGDITRVSREAPVLILRHRETRIVPGGGANATNNLLALGARVLPVTAVGDDAAGDWLVESFRDQKVDVSGIVRAKGRITPTKTRFLAGWTHTTGQQVLRVDYEPELRLAESYQERVGELFRERFRKADAVAISDYGFGVAAPEILRDVTRREKRSIPVNLDSRYGLTGYKRAGVTAATPNEAELEALHHTTIGRNTAELERCGQQTLREMNLESLVVTRGKDGMAVFQPRKNTIYIPVHGSDQAVDVTGAGDTVLAAYTLSLSSGATPVEAAHIANIAGGLVVMKRGTAIVSRKELLGAIRDAASGTAT